MFRQLLRKPTPLLRSFPHLCAAAPMSSKTHGISEAALSQSLLEMQTKSSASTVPWFLKNMPQSYFRAVQEDERLLHLNAIAALQHAQQPELMLKSPDKKVLSFIRTSADAPGILAKILESLPIHVDGNPLARVKIFSALDDSLQLDVFRYGQQDQFLGESDEEKAAEARLLAYIAEIQSGEFKGVEGHALPSDIFKPDCVKDYLRRCNSMYVKHSSPRRLASQMVLYHRVSQTEGVAVDIEGGWETRNFENKLFDNKNTSQTMITIASANVLPKNTLEKAATYLGIMNLNVLRAHMDVVKDGSNGHVTLNRILVAPSTPDTKVDWDRVSRDLKYLKWIDDRSLNIAKQHPHIPVSRAEVIIAYTNMLHGVLATTDPHAYALRRLFSVVTQPQNLIVAELIAELFEQRFDPSNPLSDAEFDTKYQHVKAEIRRNVETEDSVFVFENMLKAVKLTLRTNRYVDDRYALALRVDPALMGHGTVGTELPFGVFFIHGRRFNGFHVRFRDISRGGLRVVAPNTLEQHSFESARQFNEAYSLAFAQQLKNKDIPEGGSKAVVLVRPIEQSAYDNDRDFVIRKSVKAFSDALLDLNTTDESVKAQMVDHYGKDELIYLGPDENIIPADISWMTQRAAKRQYPVPRAFISSKPDAGINHKVYGVTSEGVAVFADVALRSQGIDPKNQSFTVKITGGTDGDVAGNMIKILHREYGSNAQIVGICDGTAVIEDVAGLDMTELLRLVEAELPLKDYDATKGGLFLTTDTPEGVRKRNSMHNRVQADLFLPAGGRPSTINENNWQAYLNEETGEPSCKLIVEGANLFITPEARQMLFDKANVVIVKDSSANKCGVICSSYEIIASMLLETQEFLDIKDELVIQVVDKLKDLARVEAELLFREHKLDPNSALPPHSERISMAIIRLHDAISNELESLKQVDEEAMLDLIKDHLPAKLATLAFDRIQTVPTAYLKCIVASSLASRIVYREGLQYAEGLPTSNLAAIAMKYLHQEKRVKALVADLQDDIPHKDEISDLLLRGGVRAGVDTN